MATVSRLSRRVRLAWIIHAALILGLVGWYLIDGLFGQLGGPPLKAHLLDALVVAPHVGLAVWVLFQYERLFSLFEAGQVFSPLSGFRLRRAGQLLLAFGLSGPVIGLVLLAVNQPELATQQIERLAVWPVMIGMSNIVIGHVMGMAYTVSEEARLTI